MEIPIREECVYDGKILRMVRMDVRQIDGREAAREIVQHPGASAVVAINVNHDIALVRQYRVAMGRFMLEIPAGKLDEGEEPLVCAKRELSEETGLDQGEWNKIGVYVSSPGFCDEVIHLFLVRGGLQGEQNLDDGEYVDVVWMPFFEAVKLVMEGEIVDGKSISGILMANQLLYKTLHELEHTV